MGGYWEPVATQWQAKHLEALGLSSPLSEAHELVAYIPTHSEVIKTELSENLGWWSTS